MGHRLCFHKRREQNRPARRNRRGFWGSVLEKLAQMGAFGVHLGGEIVPSGDSPQIDLAQEKRLWGLLLEGIGSRLILSAKEVGEGGLGIALAKMSILSRLGCAVQIALPKREMLFSQTQSCVVVETSDFAQLQELAKLIASLARYWGRC